MKKKFSFLLFTGVIVCFNIPSFAQNGMIETYHANGQVESEVFYVKDAIDGVAKWYYENGQLKEEKTYMLGKLHGWVKTYYENSAPKEEYYVNDGKLDGLYKTYYDNGGLKSIYSYEDGLLKSKKHFKYDSTLQPPKPIIAKTDSLASTEQQISELEKTQEEAPALKEESSTIKNEQTKSDSANTEDASIKEDAEFLTVVDEKPQPIGGIAGILGKVKLPAEVKKNKIKGEVEVQVFVDDEGKIVKTKVVKGSDSAINEAVQKAVEASNFLPGRKSGKAVKSQITLNIMY